MLWVVFFLSRGGGPARGSDRSQEAGQVLKGVVAEGAKTLDNIIISQQTDTYVRIIQASLRMECASSRV